MIEQYELYNDGDRVVLRKEDVQRLMNECLEYFKKEYDPEDYDYFVGEAEDIIAEAMNTDDTLIGLRDCPMSGFFTIDQSLVEEYKNGEL